MMAQTKRKKAPSTAKQRRAAILHVLGTIGSMSAAMCGELAGIPANCWRDLSRLKLEHEAVHIGGWLPSLIGGKPIAVWAIGRGEDAEKPGTPEPVPDDTAIKDWQHSTRYAAAFVRSPMAAVLGI
jgi:hypothetical protein